MATVIDGQPTQTSADLGRMHDTYRQGSLERRMAPHAVYSDATCPHAGCNQPLQGIDFRLDVDGQQVHDTLLGAWWTDVGFAGRCPGCTRWVHFTIRGKQAITDADAAKLPQLPTDWAQRALIL